MNAAEMTNELLNKWLQESEGMPITLALAELGILIVEAIEKAYNQGMQLSPVSDGESDDAYDPFDPFDPYPPEDSPLNLIPPHDR